MITRKYFKCPHKGQVTWYYLTEVMYFYNIPIPLTKTKIDKDGSISGRFPNVYYSDGGSLEEAIKLRKAIIKRHQEKCIEIKEHKKKGCVKVG